MKLGKLAEIRTGLVLNRKKATPNDSNIVSYKSLTLKSINKNGTIEEEYLEIFEAKEKLKEDYITQCNDVIVRLSHPYTSVIIDESTQGLVVPAHFVIIKCDENKIVPGYLQWLLNSHKVNKDISLSTSTSTLGTIKASFFSDLEIYELDINNQQKLSEINELAKKEVKLLKNLIEEKEKYYRELTKKIQKEMRKKQNDN